MKKAHQHLEVETNEAQAATSQDPTGEQPQNEVEILRGALAQLAADKDDLNQQLLRTMADFQNYRRRTEEEKIQFRRFATQDLVLQLLPVLDNFERALTSASSGASLESVLEGVRMVERQLRSALESQNLVRIAAVGQAFDPDLHEAIATEHSDEHEDGTVLHELEAGYKIADKVIRPARVRVAKKNS